MYRIVAGDMDETFIGRDHRVNPGNYEAVRLMRESGVKFVVATGRPFYSVQGTLADLGVFHHRPSRDVGLVVDAGRTRAGVHTGLRIAVGVGAAVPLEVVVGEVQAHRRVR